MARSSPSCDLPALIVSTENPAIHHVLPYDISCTGALHCYLNSHLRMSGFPNSLVISSWTDDLELLGQLGMRHMLASQFYVR